MGAGERPGLTFGDTHPTKLLLLGTPPEKNRIISRYRFIYFETVCGGRKHPVAVLLLSSRLL